MSHVKGLRCKECGAEYEVSPRAVCEDCFGPLEVAYDYETLRRELLQFARKKLGPGVAPREIEFIASLPKTRSGKIMRRLLKARELGLPEGDTSTLED